jgi:stearoyl-CoA desaturase (delta-9 desaturase)
MNLFWMFIITLSVLQLSVFFTTIYLHRSLTHRGLTLHPIVAFLMHLELSLFTGIVPREWVAVHRKHHQFSDEDGDPHSPVLRGMWTVLFGNFFMYRNATHDMTMVQKYTPEWKKDIIDRLPSFLTRFNVFGGMFIFSLLFGWIWGPAAWLTHVVCYILLNSAINSLGHTVGYRNYDNQATNLKWLAFLTGGEGLHNNHHRYPTSWLFAHNVGELDPGSMVARALGRMRLAKLQPLPWLNRAA